jgi:hypothetical protein
MTDITETEDAMANVTELDRPWQHHVVLRSRIQRKTGKIIFVSETRFWYGVTFNKFADPVHAAEFCFRMMQLGCVVTREMGEPLPHRARTSSKRSPP